MEKFDIVPARPKPFTLVFPHIPKTGGTTLLYHFRRNLGDDAIMSYGAYNRIVRFFGDKAQLEELTPDQIDGLHVVQGHGVAGDVLPHLSAKPLRLLVVLRHPVGLTRSRFNQRRIGLAQRGQNISADDFIARDSHNFMTSLLLEKFAAFVDPDAEGPLDQAISVLRRFNYVFTTERMDEQVAGLMGELRLDPTLERRRVAEDKAELPLSDSQIADLHPIDMEIFERVNQLTPAQDRHNALGFDAAGQQIALRKLEDAFPEKGRTQRTYAELAHAMCLNLRAEAALEKLRAGGPVALNTPARFQRVLQARWDRQKDRLTPERAAISRKWRDHWVEKSR